MFPRLRIRSFGKPAVQCMQKNYCSVYWREGYRLKGKTPLTSVATSLKRDKRFQKVGPNTFAVMTQELTAVV